MNKSLLLAVSGVVLLSACTQSRVILLPDASGKVGQVDVTSDGTTRTLSRPYQATVSDRFGAADESLSPAQVRERYGNVVDALPLPPQRYVLYFDAGSNALTEESKQQLAHIRTALPFFAAPEVIVTGHTDRVGPEAANDALSIKRAEEVREVLVAEGFARAMIAVAGRGEREPAVPTDDEVDEPKNRRVEVKIR
jgi:outer membrane protein OmpA-like peptidoglycan-associated protein